MKLTGIIIAVVLWAVGLCVFLSEYLQAKRCTVKAAAVIVDVKEEKRNDYNSHRAGKRTYYYPILSFSTPKGPVRVRTNIKGYHPDTFIRGEKLDILYNPKNPHDLKRTGTKLWEGAVGMGFFFLLGAVFLYIALRAG